jgi:hypothetical protein
MLGNFYVHEVFDALHLGAFEEQGFKGTLLGPL